MQKPDKTSHLRETLKALDNAVDEWNSLTNKGMNEQERTLDGTPINAKDLLQELSRKLEEFSESRFFPAEEPKGELEVDAAALPTNSDDTKTVDI